MAHCWNCGNEVNYPNKFCPKCGAGLSKAATSSKLPLLLFFVSLMFVYYFWDSRNSIANACNDALAKLNASASSLVTSNEKCKADLQQCVSVYNQSKQSNFQLYDQYQYCADQFSAINASFKNCQTSLSDCQSELWKFKTSPKFFFSLKINYANDTIRAQAAQAKESFRKEVLNGSITGTEIASYRDCVVDNKTGINGQEQYYLISAMGLYVWVRDNIIYVLGPPSQTTQSDLTTLRLGAGKCDEEALLLISMAKSIGLDGKLVIVKTDMTQVQCDAVNCSMYDADHAIAAIHIPGISKCDSKYFANHLTNDAEWVLLDPTCKQCKFGDLPPMDIGKAQWLLELI